MGCDVHIWVVRGDPLTGEYHMHLPLDDYDFSASESHRFRRTMERDYNRFGRWSGVRKVGPPATGWPKPLRVLIPQAHYLHSHTLLSVRVACSRYFGDDMINEEDHWLVLAKTAPAQMLFGVPPDADLSEYFVAIAYDS